MKKECTQCYIVKPLEDFAKTYNKKKDGTSIGDGRRANCRKCENKRRKKSYDNNPITRMIMNAKSRARQKGIEFNITKEDILPIPDVCPILEIPIKLGKSNFYDYAPSIDRIDSSKGYIKGNVKVVSFMANKMKSNATKEQCLAFARNILNYYDDIV